MQNESTGKKSDGDVWLTKFLKTDDLERISEAVKKAESRTTGEIVPMIVRRSSAVGHVPMLLTLLLVVIHLALEVMILTVEWGFSAFSPLAYTYIHYLNFAVFIFLLLAVFSLSKKLFIQRWLTHPLDRDLQVWERAELEFHRLNLAQTHERTGILLFVSLMEHEAVVLADKAIAAKLPAETWQNIVDILVGGIKSGSPTSGFEAAIKLCGEILAQHFPSKEKNLNELPNRLVIKAE